MIRLALLSLLILHYSANAAPTSNQTSPVVENALDIDLDIDPDDIFFWYFTRSTLDNPQRISLDEIRRLNINRRLPLKVIIHGWLESLSSFWYSPIIEAYFATSDVSLIALNWNEHALASYIYSVRTARQVGILVGRLLEQIQQLRRVPFSSIHVIGHSLGAQIAGFAGKNVFNRTGEKLGRITGLDPAGPLFNLNGPQERLDSSDAVFVDVIHTDGNVLGIGRDIGHADFYPNGGTAIQSGCGLINIICSHNRAPFYYIESIIFRNNYIGRECRSSLAFDLRLCRNNEVAVMGEGASPDTRGSFYFSTRSAFPYGQGLGGA